MQDSPYVHTHEWETPLDRREGTLAGISPAPARGEPKSDTLASKEVSMSLFEDVMALAVQMPVQERERLASALGVKLAPSAPSNLLPMANAAASMDPLAWRKAERGHAVLATDGPGAGLEPGPASLRGIWAEMDLLTGSDADALGAANQLGRLAPGSPVVVHTNVVLGLALGLESVREFWDNPPVEVRLATGTYLKLLEMCLDAEEKKRVRAFVQPYAVLSLGPMASSRAVELLLSSPRPDLTALDALIAATAIAHEIPLVTRDPRPFEGLAGLQVLSVG